MSAGGSSGYTELSHRALPLYFLSCQGPEALLLVLDDALVVTLELSS